MESHTQSSQSVNELILMGVKAVTRDSFGSISFMSDDGDFSVRVPLREWQAMGKPEVLHFGLSTRGLAVGSDHNVKLHDPRSTAFFVPLAPEVYVELHEDWSEPVQVKIENREMVVRKLKRFEINVAGGQREAWLVPADEPASDTRSEGADDGGK